MPIRWDNINGANLSEASRPLESAQRSFQGAFDSVGGILNQTSKIDDANWQNTKNNNTTAYLDQLAQYATPQDLERAKADGSLDRLRSQYGQQIDANAVRGAADDLLSKRYQQVTAANEFKDKSLTREQRPIHDAILTKAYAGDVNGAMDLLAANPGLMNSPEIQKQVSDYKQVLHQRGQDDTRFTWDGEKHVADIEHLKNSDRVALGQLAVAQGQLKVSQGQLGINQQTANMAQQDRLEQRLASAIDGLGKARQATASSLEGQTAIFSNIAENFKGDPNGAINARRAYGDIIAKNPGISTADAMGAILTQDGSRWYKIDSVVRSNTVDRAQTSAGTEESKQRALQAELGKAAADERYRLARAAEQAGPNAVNVNALKQAARGGKPAGPIVVPTGASFNNAGNPGIPFDDRAPMVPLTPASAGQGGTYGPNGWVPNAPVNVPSSGATVAPRSPEEAQARASEEALKARLAQEWAARQPLSLSPAELRAKKEQEDRNFKATMARGRSGNSNK